MDALASKKADPLLGVVLGGNYRLEARIGEGTTGVVYEGRQLALGLRVAVKVMHRELQSQLAFVSRFHVEARAASAIAHENTTRILDYGVDPLRGFLYIAMEYLEGQTLEEMLRSGTPLAPARVVDIALQVLAALGAAHKLGILHRDLGPHRIVIQQRENDESRTRDFVKVCDFGMAPLADDTGWEGGGVVGGAEYLAPEQILGGVLDARSDLYSVGAILSQMLTGRLPLPAGSDSRLRVSVDPELAAIGRRATSQAPENRYRSARQMRAALQATSTFRALSGTEWPAEVPSVRTSIPPAFDLQQPQARRQGLHVATPCVTIPVTNLPLSPTDQVDTRPPPPMSPPPTSPSSVPPSSVPPPTPTPSLRPTDAAAATAALEEAAALEARSRRAATVGSKRRNELAARRTRRTSRIVALGGLVSGIVVLAVGFQHLKARPAASAVPSPISTGLVAPPSPSAAPLPVSALAPLAPDRPASSSASSSDRSASPSPTLALSVVTPSPTPKKDTRPSPPAATEDTSQPVLPVVKPAPLPALLTPASASTPAPPSAREASSSAPVTATMAVAPPPAPFHPDAARVDVVKTDSERVAPHAVNDAVRHANLQRCYVDALKRAGAAREGTAVLTLSIDENRIASSDLRGLDLPGLSACVSSQLANARVATADMGDATASITLRFSVP